MPWPPPPPCSCSDTPFGGVPCFEAADKQLGAVLGMVAMWMLRARKSVSLGPMLVYNAMATTCCSRPCRSLVQAC